MNKKTKKLIPFVIIFLMIVVGIVALYFLISPMVQEYNTEKNRNIRAKNETKKMQAQQKRFEQEKKEQEEKLKTLKPIYKSEVPPSADTLSAFGNMFEDIIKRVQYNGLMIRSLEYDMKPTFDPVFKHLEAQYNTCELKFFLIGTYSQLQSFLVEINNDFPYMISISKLDVSTFIDNTDYVVIHLSLNIYSKK